MEKSADRQGKKQKMVFALFGLAVVDGGGFPPANRKRSDAVEELRAQYFYGYGYFKFYANS